MCHARFFFPHPTGEPTETSEGGMRVTGTYRILVFVSLVLGAPFTLLTAANERQESCRLQRLIVEGPYKKICILWPYEQPT